MFKKLYPINKVEIGYLSIILLVFILLIMISFGKWGYPTIDCFRNAYVPAEIIKGKTLYKDIFYFYCPLIPYFHSLLFKLFGVHLNVLYFSGIVSSLIILLGAYFLSRQIMDPLGALFFIIFFEVFVIFRPGLFQFIFPYAYEGTYGCLIEIVLLIFLFKFVKHDFKSFKFLYLASITVSISSLIKQDILISSYLLLFLSVLVFLVFKKVSFKQVLFPIILSILLPIVYYAFILLFIPYNDLIQGLFPFGIFNEYFLNNYAGIYIDSEVIGTILRSFGKRLLGFSVLIGIIYCLITLYKSKFKSYLLLIPLAIIGLGIGFYVSNNSLPMTELKNMYDSYTHLWLSPNAFQWIVVFSLLITFYSLLYLRTKRYKDDNKLFLIIIVSLAGFLMLIRSPLGAVTQSFANIYIFASFMTLFYFIYSEIPCLIPKINLYNYSLSIYTGILLIIIPAFIYYYQRYDTNNIKISSDRGFIYTTLDIGQVIQESINYVRNNSSDKDTILTTPEETVINFMANRSNATKYYQLLPDFIKPGSPELRVIEEIKKNNPKIILISNNNVVKYYGKMYWGIDYNQFIYNWIDNNYKTCGSIGLYSTSDSYYSYGIKILKKDCD